jgi:hypothetical protein
MLSMGGVEGRGEMGASRLKLLVRRTGGWNLCFQVGVSKSNCADRCVVNF